MRRDEWEKKVYDQPVSFTVAARKPPGSPVGRGWPALLSGATLVKIFAWPPAAVLAVVAILLFAPARAQAWSPVFQPYEAYETGSWPESVAIGDVTGDGRNDVLMTTSYYFDTENDFKLFLFPQRPDGSLDIPRKLATSGQYSDPMGVAIGDLDGDRALDAAVATAAGIDAFYQRNGTLTAPEPVPNSPRPARQVLIKDMDRDGRNDLVVNSGAGIAVMTNRTAGFTQSRISAEGVTELEHGDVNADSYPDLVGIAGQRLRLFEQTPGGGSFTARSIGLAGSWGAQGLAVADVDGADADDDVVIARGGNRPASTIEIYPQLSPGGISGTPLTYGSYDIPEPVAAADMDGDARKDVATLHGGWLKTGLYPQLSSGGLGVERLFDIPYASHYNAKGLALGDLSCDGRRDMAIADYNHGLVLLRHVPSHPGAVGGPCESTTPDPEDPSGRAPATSDRPPPAAVQRPVSSAPRAHGPRMNLVKSWRRRYRHVRIRLACDTPCLVLAKGVVTLARHSTLKSSEVSRRLRLAPVLQRLRPREPLTLKLRIPARTRQAALRAFAKGRRPTARILLTGTDDSGNTSARRIRVRMRD